MRTVWQMARDKRVQAWEALGRFDELQVLLLGGDLMDECPLDLEELRLLLPLGQDALRGLRHLALKETGVLGDDVLFALAGQGCGGELTSLSLDSCVLSFLCFVFFFVVVFVFVFLSSSSPPSVSWTALLGGVTDAGIRTLVEQGCGKKMVALELVGALFVPVSLSLSLSLFPACSFLSENHLTFIPSIPLCCACRSCIYVCVACCSQDWEIAPRMKLCAPWRVRDVVLSWKYSRLSVCLLSLPSLLSFLAGGSPPPNGSPEFD